MHQNSRIFIVGHKDSVENSLLAHFKAQGFKAVYSNNKNKINVLDQTKTAKFFKEIKPEYVFLGSIRSGGIAANLKSPAEFIYENSLSQTNVIHSALGNKVKKLLYFTGSCAYPAFAKQPIKESSLLSGKLEKSSEPYSVAKIAGTKMCQAYKAQYGFNAIVAVPATLYGPGSDDDLETAHVMGALIAKFVKAVVRDQKEVLVWGTGKPRREFLYVDDFVSACTFLMDQYNGLEMINLGSGFDVSIKELSQIIARISGFKGKIKFDTTKPDGTMRKLMDSSKISKLGWKPKVSIEQGVFKTIQWYRKVKA